MEPQISEEGDFYKVLIPKSVTSIDNIKVFLSNILKSEVDNSKESRVAQIIEELSKKWPDEEKLTAKSYSDLQLLVIDDQSSIRKIMKNSLKELQFQTSNIDEADNAITALQKMTRKKFDIIFSDWNMPIMSGLDFLKVLKGIPGLKNIFFIMVTTRGNQENVMEAIESGIDGYIIKPFTTAQIEKVLKKVVPLES